MDLILGQLIAGLSYGSTLFLVSAGLTLIFGVTRVVNFAHGSLYMLGAYIAYTITTQWAPNSFNFFGGLLLAALAVAVVGALIEIVLLRRIYSSPEMFQLLATFGVVLIVQDVALAIWGPGELFAPRAPGLKGSVEIAGAFVPQYSIFVMTVGPTVYALLWWLINRTRWGMWVRAASQDRETASALGLNEPALFTSVFALGALLAGLAGALQIPRETVNLQMDLSILIEAFVVVVVGGLGSVTGAFWSALLIGMLHAFGSWWFPQSTLVLIFVVMAVVLILRPYGLLGRQRPRQSTRMQAHPPFVAPVLHWRVVGAVALGIAIVLPMLIGDYAIVIATEVAIAAVLAASLHFGMGLGGIVSFGHAAFFGLGAYTVALAIKYLDTPFAAALILAPIIAGASALLVGRVVLRSHGVYAAMLTLAFAQILWSTAIQWVDLTGGDNGVLGIWSVLPSALSSALAYYTAAAAIAVASLAALRRIALAPFGFALRAARDSELRADAIGIDTQRIRWLAFSVGGFFAGVAGALHAFHKGSVFPTTLSIPVSVDALIMVLLGGVQTLVGPIVGALAYHALSTELTRLTDHWRLFLGLAIVILAIAFPDGIVGFARRRFAKKMMSLLQVEQLHRSFGGVRAVDGVSFAVTAGEIAALIGPNGAGKSTLFNLIDGQLAPQAGRVLFNGESLTAWSTAERTRRGIGRTFQVAQTFATLTVLQNVQLALVAAQGGALGVTDLLWDLRAEAANSLLAQVGLQQQAADAAATLAYGDIKRLELALALAAKPRLLLMDEPTAGMAMAERFALMQTIVGLAGASNMAVLFTEHSMDVVFGFARRVLVLSRGRMIADGVPEAVRADTEVQRLYLGEEA